MEMDEESEAIRIGDVSDLKLASNDDIRALGEKLYLTSKNGD